MHARQRARDIAAELGFEHQDQIRLATAASELARNAFRYAEGGEVSFSVTQVESADIHRHCGRHRIRNTKPC